MKDNKKWYYCPCCRQKILKYDELKAKSQKIFVICKKCKKEIEININIE